MEQEERTGKAVPAMPRLPRALRTRKAAPGPSCGLCFLTATRKSPEKHQTREETPTTPPAFQPPPSLPTPAVSSERPRVPRSHRTNRTHPRRSWRSLRGGVLGRGMEAAAGPRAPAEPPMPPRRRPASGGVPGGGSRPGNGGAGAAPGAAPAPGPPPTRRSIPGWAGRADSRARRPPRAHRPGSARRRRRSCPAPTCGGGCPGRVGGSCRRRRLRSLSPCLPALQDEPGVFPALLAAHHPRHLLGQRQQLAVSSRGEGGGVGRDRRSRRRHLLMPPGAAEQVPLG